MFGRSSVQQTSNAKAASSADYARASFFHLLIPSVIALTLLCTSFAFVATWRWEDAQAQKDLAVASEGHFGVVQGALDDYLGKLAALQALFESRNDVTRAEFATFTQRLLRYEGEVQNLSWVPHVWHAERKGHEIAARTDGIPGYSIRTSVSERRLVVSAEKDEYLPIYYTSGRPNDSPVYGIDLWSIPEFRAKMGPSRDTGRLSVVPNVLLRSLEGDVRAIVLSLPVYDRSRPSRTIEERRGSFIGFAHGTFQIKSAIDFALNTATTARGLDLYVFASDAAADALPLHHHRSRLRTGPIETKRLGDVLRERHVAGKLVAGDVSWTMLALPLPGGPMDASYTRAWFVLAAGLLIGTIVVFHLLASVRYARKLTAANATISNLAQTDALTGLMNRRAFAERLEEAFAASRRGAAPFALLYFDLDNFKDVNDTRGHQVGDLLLQEAAKRVKEVIRRSDVFARFGGDEFALLQFNGQNGSPAVLASKINEVLASPFVIEGGEIQISASVGIARYSDEVATPDVLLMQADLALYRAKEDGRNCYCFHSEQLDSAVNNRVTVASELRTAITRGELRLFYQPQVELASGRIVGVEALVRWQHPQRGLVNPSEFIGVAERSGSIIALGEWSLAEACRQMRAWKTLGVAPAMISINCSAAQFKPGYSIERQIQTVLEAVGLSASDIELELTETVLMEVAQQNDRVLENIRRMDVGIAIDDFGTGYSSLNYLAQYPINRLKIAQQLVLGVTYNARHAAVVRAAVHLARDLGIHCIAEGVESREQADFLVAAGCEAAQGFLFGKPIAAEAMTQRLREQKLRGMAAAEIVPLHAPRSEKDWALATG